MFPHGKWPRGHPSSTSALLANSAEGETERKEESFRAVTLTVRAKFQKSKVFSLRNIH